MSRRGGQKKPIPSPSSVIVISSSSSSESDSEESDEPSAKRRRLSDNAQSDGIGCCPVTDLPPELIVEILTFLPFQDLVKFRGVSQLFRNILHTHGTSESIFGQYRARQFRGLVLYCRVLQGLKDRDWTSSDIDILSELHGSNEDYMMKETKSLRETILQIAEKHGFKLGRRTLMGCKVTKFSDAHSSNDYHYHTESRSMTLSVDFCMASWKFTAEYDVASQYGKVYTRIFSDSALQMTEPEFGYFEVETVDDFEDDPKALDAIAGALGVNEECVSEILERLRSKYDCDGFFSEIDRQD